MAGVLLNVRSPEGRMKTPQQSVSSRSAPARMASLDPQQFQRSRSPGSLPQPFLHRGHSDKVSSDEPRYVKSAEDIEPQEQDLNPWSKKLILTIGMLALCRTMITLLTINRRGRNSWLLISHRPPEVDEAYSRYRARHETPSKVERRCTFSGAVSR